ncbi:MAG TPA: hypothetical protein VFT95_12335 [Micromonosporaceae bacterium]|nr:hypothetical protein [Micromonosporaceae bacterium]
MAFLRIRNWQVVVALVCVGTLSAACDLAGSGDSDSADDHTLFGVADPSYGDAQIVLRGRDGGRSIINDVATGEIVTMTSSGHSAICLDHAGSVTIDTVLPDISSGDLDVEAVAVTHVRDGGLDVPAPPAPGFPATLDLVCDPPADSGLPPAVAADLRLWLRKVSDDAAVADRFHLLYTSSGRTYELVLHWPVALCGDRSDPAEECSRNL